MPKPPRPPRKLPLPIPKKLYRFADRQFRTSIRPHIRQLNDYLELPIRVVLYPFTLAYDIVGSAPRGFGIPEFVSKLSSSALIAVAAFAACDVALSLGTKVICPRNCNTCSGWYALRCTMCKGTGKVMYQVKNCALRRGEKATAETIADAIIGNRAELLHFPSTVNPNIPLPSKDCQNCDGTGVMKCPECKDKFSLRISADNIIEPPWEAYNIVRKMDYPYEHIIDSMKDPSIAAFWLITMPQIMGGFEFDDEVKQKIWWQYQENMRYDRLRDAVAKRQPGWEHLQEALISIDPVRARDDPVIVKNVPYHRVKSVLQAEVTKLDPPPRPQNWGDLNLPLNASSWSEEELKDPKKSYEMTVLLNAQREIADKILDDQWATKWRQEKLNEMLEEKLQTYMQTMDSGLPQSIVMNVQYPETKRRPRRWWIF